MLLRKEIDNRDLPLGSTPQGRDWCIKALHPADPLTEVRGIPDHGSVPSVFLNYQSTYTIAPTAGCADGWSFEMSLLPHPVNFAYWATHDSLNPMASSDMLNPQLAGASHTLKYQNWIAMAQRWRLAYMSVTLYQDGPDLANQGTLVACQHSVEPIVTHDTYYEVATNHAYGSVRLHSYTADDLPNYDVSQAMPNAYFNRSKEGCYMPLKLTETCQDWVSDAHSVGNTNHIFAAAGGSYCYINNAVTTAWPHCQGVVNNLGETYHNGVVPISGQRTSPFLSGAVGQLCGKNLAAATRFSVFIRCGLEVQVNPTSVLAPQQTLSPQYDSVALDNYFCISRELKDAYPANYNDLGKMWDAISAATRTLLPFLKPAFPRAANVIGYGLAAGDAVRKRNLRKKTKAKRGTEKVSKQLVKDVAQLGASGKEALKQAIEKTTTTTTTTGQRQLGNGIRANIQRRN